MALVNGRSIRNALKIFMKEHGREPTIEEFVMLVSGNTTKKVKE